MMKHAADQTAARGMAKNASPARPRTTSCCRSSFALYGFPSRAASFALLVYASAYLKAHFPRRSTPRSSTASR
jgi:DNA polymerase III alpha subunit